MFNAPAPTDPRERLVSVGNELLNAIYELEATRATVDEMQNAKDDKEKLSELMKEPNAAEALIRHIIISGKRDSALREYITIRQTIESLTAPASA